MTSSPLDEALFRTVDFFRSAHENSKKGIIPRSHMEKKMTTSMDNVQQSIYNRESARIGRREASTLLVSFDARASFPHPFA